MRAWMTAMVLVVAGCKGHKDKATPNASAKSALAVPKVSVASVLAKETPAPPFLLLVDDSENVRMAAALTWADLDAQKIKIAKKAGPLEFLDRQMREDFALGKTPMQGVTFWDSMEDAIDLASLEDTRHRNDTGDMDDPPPPEEGDMPDDGADESGGTGTAMALDEGKMGKADAERAEGQYKMVPNQEDPQLARQQAIEQARNAGILGAKRSGVDGPPLSWEDDIRPNDDGTPSRIARVEGSVMPNGTFERLRVMIFIAPTAKATKLIDVIRETGGAIAVENAGKIRPLNLEFDARDYAMQSSEYWLEARVSTKGIVVEGVPDKAVEVAKVEELAAAIAKAREARGADAESPVDVLVDPDVDVQRMTDVMVALETAGVHTIGIGPMPSAEQLARRGKRIATMHLGVPNAQGDLDKKEIRKVVKANLGTIKGCYDKALVENPALTGTVSAQFFISPKGTVASSSAAGVDPAVSDCIAAAIKTFVFPKPNGGGGVQVNYPFTMRP
jgi:hypothetical protein